MIPWWGWVIYAVVTIATLYGVAALVFFHKASKRVFKTHDEISKSMFGDKDPFDSDFFKRPL